ncbi:MAG: hypothetical protein PVG98_00485 [Chromatiales bacterium]|jgi:hypothetical protein
METALSLTVPKSDSVEHPSIEQEAARLGDWIRSLPYGDPESAAKRLGESLYHLNRSPGAVPRRIDLMACYDEAFQRLFGICLRRSLLSRSADQSRSDRRYAELIRKLAVEMAYGYKLVIQPRRAARRAGPTAPALIHALQMLQIGLLFSYARYRPPATSTWTEFCALYAEAERLGLQETPVRVSDDGESHQTTCSALLKRAALLALLDPYRLSPGDIWHADAYLKRWAGRAELTTVEAGQHAEHAAVIDLRGTPPRPYAPDKAYQPVGRFLLVDPAPLRDVVGTHLEALEDPESRRSQAVATLEPSRAAQLLRHMQHAWYGAPRRQSPRKERYEWLPVASGLGAVVGQLRREPRGLEFAALPTEGAEEGGRPGPMSGRAAESGALRLRQFNRSASGVGVRVRLPTPPGLSVGQLVLVKDEGSRNGGSVLGIVRRMILRDSTNAEVGIEFLETAVAPVELRPLVFGEGRKPDFQPGLIAEGPERGSRGMLLTPRHMFKPGREYMVALRGSNLRVMAERLVESNTGFDRFEYRVSLKDRAV